METINISFIGLGVMGYPTAGFLSKVNNYSVKVYNRTRSKAENWSKEYDGQIANSPSDVAKDADIVITCVGNDDDLREVVNGKSGILASIKPGSLIIDHTSVSAQVSREMSEEASKKGVGFLDAPVSGGESGAKNGKLSIMVGGSEDDFVRAKPVMKTYSVAINLMGPVGSGQLTKMVNQICIAGAVQSLAEGIHFGLNAGLDMEKVLDVISKGAAQSWQLENRGPTILDNKFDFGFAVELMRKDLTISLFEARNNNSSLPNTAIVEQYYANLQRRGKGRLDFTSLFSLLHESDS